MLNHRNTRYGRWLFLVLCVSSNARHIPDHLENGFIVDSDLDLTPSAAEPRPVVVESSELPPSALPWVYTVDSSGDASEKVEKALKPSSDSSRAIEDNDSFETRFPEDQEPEAVDYYKYVAKEEAKDGAGASDKKGESSEDQPIAEESKHHDHKGHDHKGHDHKGHDHKEEHGEYEKGGGKEHDSKREEEHGEKGEKEYDGKHHHEHGKHGKHKKHGHAKKYHDEGEGEKKHHHEDGYHGEHHKGEEGKKGSKYDEEGEHSKGHSTKGSHSIRKKEEYEKKTEFFDEDDEGGHFEKHGGFKHAGGHKKGGHEKHGHHKGGKHDEHHGEHKAGEKGGHHKHHEEHKDGDGHDHHHSHHHKHGEKKGHSHGAKWGHHKSHGHGDGGHKKHHDHGGHGSHSHVAYEVQQAPKKADDQDIQKSSVEESKEAPTEVIYVPKQPPPKQNLVKDIERKKPHKTEKYLSSPLSYSVENPADRKRSNLEAEETFIKKKKKKAPASEDEGDDWFAAHGIDLPTKRYFLESEKEPTPSAEEKKDEQVAKTSEQVTEKQPVRKTKKKVPKGFDTTKKPLLSTTTQSYKRLNIQDLDKSRELSAEESVNAENEKPPTNEKLVASNEEKKPERPLRRRRIKKNDKSQRKPKVTKPPCQHEDEDYLPQENRKFVIVVPDGLSLNPN